MRKTIFIYKGPGASKESLRHAWASLEEAVGSFYSLSFLSTRALHQGGWCEHAALLVMPGGQDLPYVKYLSGQGTQLIRAYVQAGGAYLGLCAGAYFGASDIVFNAGALGEIAGERELKFFPGTVKGPLFTPYEIGSFRGSRVVPLEWTDALFSNEGVFFMSGGGYFENAEGLPGVQILAYCADPEDAPRAVVALCTFGSGRVLLSHVHLEYTPLLLNPQDVHVASLIAPMQECEPHRKTCFRMLLEKVGIRREEVSLSLTERSPVLPSEKEMDF